MGLPGADADDVCQDVFVTVHQKLGDYDGRASVRAWVFGIAVKKAADHRRRAFRRYEVTTEHVPEAGTVDDAGAKVDERRALQFLDEVLDRLDVSKRAAFVLHEIEGLSLQEVALALDCPLQTAYSRVAAARDQVTSAMRKRQQRERMQ